MVERKASVGRFKGVIFAYSYNVLVDAAMTFLQIVDASHMTTVGFRALVDVSV
ncbi:MAG TPA: hypothetical protein VE641_21270 [Chthoniobacterales bacterium]|nr:hypothetical protein [Chthoniobacterales bacterium]